MPVPSSPSDPRPVLGWREWISLPGLGVPWIKAKVDTGARSSALHVTEVEAVDSETVRFRVHPHQRRTDGSVVGRARLVDHRSVRSSSGVAEERPVVELEVAVGGLRWPVEVTLTRRDDMGFRMLLGRTAVRGRFLVDPGGSYLQRHPPTPKRDP